MFTTLLLSLAAQSAPLTVEVRGISRPAAGAANTVDAAQLRVGKAVYAVRCQMCHGADGNADTPMGRKVQPTPMRFTDVVWQQKATNEGIAEMIVKGGAGMQRSPVMPAATNLKPGELEALVAYVRQFKSSTGSAQLTITSSTGSVVVSGVADTNGTAKVVVPNVQGAVKVVGVDSAGRACSVDVPEAAGAVVVCAR
jgi:mono/diheme cytochrome c family protein